jgi:hypothetical protein
MLAEAVFRASQGVYNYGSAKRTCIVVLQDVELPQLEGVADIFPGER